MTSPLNRALTHRDTQVREAALRAIDKAVTAAADDMLNCEDTGGMKRLASIAAELADAGAAVTACLDDDTPSVAVAAATALGQLAFAGAEELLSGPFGDEARLLVAALGARSEPTLVRAAATGPAAMRAAATTALGHIAGNDLAIHAGLVDPAPEVRVSAARALVRRAGNHPVTAVIALHDDPDVTVREVAIAHGCQHGDASVAPALLARLGELAVEELAPPRTTQPIYVLSVEEEPTSAYDVLRWLYWLGLRQVPEALPLVLALLSRGRGLSHQYLLVLVLSDVTDDACIDPLCALLPARDSTTGGAAIALGRMRATRAAGLLAAALDGPGVNDVYYDDVRAAVVRALASIGAYEHMARVDEIPAGRCDDAVIDSLVRMGSLRAATRARRALDDGRFGVLAAARALGRCGDTRDLDRLRRACANHRPAVREAAAVSLATLAPTLDAIAGLHATDDPLAPVDVLELAHAWIALVARVPAARANARAFVLRAHHLLDAVDRRRRNLAEWTTYEEIGYLWEARDVVAMLAQHAHEF